MFLRVFEREAGFPWGSVAACVPIQVTQVREALGDFDLKTLRGSGGYNNNSRDGISLREAGVSGEVCVRVRACETFLLTSQLHLSWKRMGSVFKNLNVGKRTETGDRACVLGVRVCWVCVCAPRLSRATALGTDDKNCVNLVSILPLSRAFCFSVSLMSWEAPHLGLVLSWPRLRCSAAAAAAGGRAGAPAVCC